MQEYWGMISKEHHQKLIALAEKHKVETDTALRNIINYLQESNKWYAYAVTAKQIEEIIDTLTV